MYCYRITMVVLSIVIPVRNRQGSLSELLNQLCVQVEAASVRAEIIVIDDASLPPISVPHSSSFGQIRLIRSDQSLGAQASRRRGLSVAIGDIIHFHDSDDLLTNDWVESVVEAFSLDHDLGVLISSRMKQSGAGCMYEINPHVAARLCGDMRWFRHYQRFRNAIGPIGGVTFRRRVLSMSDFVVSPASQDWLLYDAVLARNPKCIVRHDIRFIYRELDESRISASARRRVKGFVSAARYRFRYRWSRRLASVIYCAHAGPAVHGVVRVRSDWLVCFLGNRLARSRLLSRVLLPQYR
ncbi:glycosyltransferase family 2 protein [Leptospira interrogans]